MCPRSRCEFLFPTVLFAILRRGGIVFLFMSSPDPPPKSAFESPRPLPLPYPLPRPHANLDSLHSGFFRSSLMGRAVPFFRTPPRAFPSSAPNRRDKNDGMTDFCGLSPFVGSPRCFLASSASLPPPFSRIFFSPQYALSSNYSSTTHFRRLSFQNVVFPQIVLKLILSPSLGLPIPFDLSDVVRPLGRNRPRSICLFQRATF